MISMGIYHCTKKNGVVVKELSSGLFIRYELRILSRLSLLLVLALI